MQYNHLNRTGHSIQDTLALKLVQTGRHESAVSLQCLRS